MKAKMPTTLTKMMWAPIQITLAIAIHDALNECTSRAPKARFLLYSGRTDAQVFMTLCIVPRPLVAKADVSPARPKVAIPESSSGSRSLTTQMRRMG
jgi:hypothetical protein